MSEETKPIIDLDAPTAPTLSFGEPEPENPPAVKEPEIVDTMADLAKDAESQLSAEQLAQVDAFVKQIDITNSSAIMTYGATTQKKLADFSETALDTVRTKDLGQTGELLTSLVTQLKGFDASTEEKKGFLGLFAKSANHLEELKTRYSKVETSVASISNELEKHQVTLLKDVDILDKMYDMNLDYFKELTMYILAGKKKLNEVRATDLVAAQQKAEQTGLEEDAQAARDLGSQCDRFEKKLYDLELTRTIAMQTAPQIRMVQSSDTMMAEKIQSTIVNTIPLWKNQMVIALGVEHATQAAKAEHAVTETTNELLKKNAEALHTATVETAKEAECGIVDIETLRHTNEQLISAMDEVITIQKEGKAQRAAAETELAQIETELKSKLLEASRS